MKILYHHRIGSKDGQCVHVQELQKAIRELGHELVIVEPAQFSGREFGADSGIVQTLRAKTPGFVNELLELGYALVDYSRLRKAVLKHRPACIYERYNLFTPSGAWAKSRLGLPMLVEVNAPLFEERAKFGGITLGRLASWSERFVWRSGDYVLPVTDVLAGYVQRAGVPRSRIVTIPNGVNLEDFKVSEEERRNLRGRLGVDGKLVLGFTGFVREWHGLDRALDVIAEHGDRFDLHLLIVGDGPGCASLRQKAEALGVHSNVTVTGIVDRPHVPRYIAAFDMALQPNVVAYASPLKIFEYLAMGKPTIAPDMPNIREILTDGENAVLFDPADGKALGDAVVRLCADADLRTRFGAAGRQLVLERDLTWQHNARKVVGLMQGL